MDLFGHPNSTILYGWQPEPRTRGTWSIISSCLATMTLCIWTSLHLNMPRRQDKMHNMVLRKMGWLVCGLFAPELVSDESLLVPRNPTLTLFPGSMDCIPAISRRKSAHQDYELASRIRSRAQTSSAMVYSSSKRRIC